MASASLAQLTRLLLRRSDRHPVGRLNGNDEKAADAAVFSRFLNLGLLIEEPPLTEVDGLFFETIGNRAWGFCSDGTADSQTVTVDDLTQFRIDLTALCRQIRKANGMQGAPIEKLSPFTFRIGAIGTGIRRRQFILARALRAKNALQVAHAIKGQSDDGAIVILTPTERNLPAGTTKLLQATQIEIISIEEYLDESATEPFTLRLFSAPSDQNGPAEATLLHIDTGGHRIFFHNCEVNLAPREFDVLVLLANEASDEAGIVSHDTLLDSLRRADDREEVTPWQLDKVISSIRGIMTSAAGMPREDGPTLIKNKRKIGFRLDLPARSIRIV